MFDPGVYFWPASVCPAFLRRALINVGGRFRGTRPQVNCVRRKAAHRRERSRRGGAGRGGAGPSRVCPGWAGRAVAGTACCGRHFSHAAECPRGPEPGLVHRRRGRHRHRAPGRGGAGRPPWRCSAPSRTGTARGCGVSAGRPAAAPDGLPRSSVLGAPGIPQSQGSLLWLPCSAGPRL